MNQTLYCIVTERLGIPVYPLMNLNEKPTRSLRFGDGFTAYQTFTKSATQFWAQITNNGTGKEEYALISIGSKKYAELHPDQPEAVDINPQFFLELYQWALARGYTGSAPF